MGRNCGWLTAYSAFIYNKRLNNINFIPDIGLDKSKWKIHGIYIPELSFNLQNEVKRLNTVMNKNDCVNIFLSEGAGIENIIKDKKEDGKDVINFDEYKSKKEGEIHEYDIKSDFNKIIETMKKILSDKDNEIMYWVYLGYKYNEIAKKLKMNIGTIASRINRSHEKIREELLKKNV